MIGLEAIKCCLIFCVLLAAAWTDISRMRIPNWLIGTGWILRIPFFIAEWGLGGKGALIQGGRELAGSVFLILGLALLAVLSRHGLGFGDVKLLGTVALYGGIEQTLVCLLYGLFLSAGISLALLAFRKINRKDRLPLAPFFLAGYLFRLFIH